MDFAFTEDQLAIKDSVGKLCAGFQVHVEDAAGVLLLDLLGVLELLRVGDIPDATREIDALGLLKSDAAPPVLWAVALLYARSGAAKRSSAPTSGR